MGRRKLTLALQLMLSIALLAFILHQLDLSALAGILSKADLTLLLVSTLLYIALNLLNSFKLGLLVHSKKKLFEFRELFFVNMAGMLASDVTPGRAGYFYTIMLLKNRLRKAHGAAALTVFQLTEIIVKVIGAIVASLFLIGFLSGTELPSYLFLSVALLLIAVVFLFLLVFSGQSERFFSWSKKLLPSFISFQEHAKATKGVFFYALGITLFGWFLRGLEWFFLAHAVGLPLDPFQALLLHPLITVFSFIPVTIAGLGLMEFAGITVITNMGVAPAASAAETIFAFLLLDRAMNVFVDLLGLKKLVSFK